MDIDSFLGSTNINPIENDVNETLEDAIKRLRTDAPEVVDAWIRWQQQFERNQTVSALYNLANKTESLLPQRNSIPSVLRKLLKLTVNRGLSTNNATLEEIVKDLRLEAPNMVDDWVKWQQQLEANQTRNFANEAKDNEDKLVGAAPLLWPKLRTAESSSVVKPSIDNMWKAIEDLKTTAKPPESLEQAITRLRPKAPEIVNAWLSWQRNNERNQTTSKPSQNARNSENQKLILNPLERMFGMETHPQSMRSHENLDETTENSVHTPFPWPAMRHLDDPQLMQHRFSGVATTEDPLKVVDKALEQIRINSNKFNDPLYDINKKFEWDNRDRKRPLSFGRSAQDDTLSKEMEHNPVSTASRNSEDNIKLKLMKELIGEGKSDDQAENFLSKLLEPEKKSDSTLETLKTLLKAKEDQKKQDNLIELLKNLNAKPQIKNDDFILESELSQLQKAINGLRPQNPLDFSDLGNRRGRDQDFQTMLSQIVSQNSVNPGTASAINFGDASAPIDKRYLISNNPQYLNPYSIQQLNGYVPRPIVNSYGMNTYDSYLPGSFKSPGNYGGRIIPDYGLGNYNGKLISYPNEYSGNKITDPYNDGKLFPVPNPYQAYRYGQSGFVGPNQDQSYVNKQAGEQYKSGMIYDLNQQIDNLERVISNLHQGQGYYPNEEDKGKIAALEQRIYELKGVITNLNTSPPSNNYGNQPISYTQRPIQSQQPNTAPTNVYDNHPPQEPNQSPYGLYQPPPPPQEQPKPAPTYQPTKSRNNLDDLKRRKRQSLNEVKVQNRFGEELGKDSVNEMVNVFKQYFQDRVGNDATPANLQLKLKELAKELDSKRSSERSSSDYLNSYNPSNINYPLQPFSSTSTKKTDILSEIISKILPKVFDALPEVLSKHFAQEFNAIGNSYGDYNSPLQSVLNNLGRVGFLPLVLVKILESSGTILAELKKNKLFKQLILPGSVLGLVAGAILFLIYFLQQDEPYYLDYNNNNAYYKSNRPKNYGYNREADYGYRRSEDFVPDNRAVEQYYGGYSDDFRS